MRLQIGEVGEDAGLIQGRRNAVGAAGGMVQADGLARVMIDDQDVPVAGIISETGNAVMVAQAGWSGVERGIDIHSPDVPQT